MSGHVNVYDIQTVTQIFFPNENFEQVDDASGEGVTVASILKGDGCLAQVFSGGGLKCEERLPLPPSADEHETRRLLMISMFLACKAFTGRNPPWGALAGIRPAKMARLMLEKGVSRDDIISSLERDYFASPEKIALAADVALASLRVLGTQSKDGFSLYIGIPFCPSRCLYCSFASNQLKSQKGADPYLIALLRELRAISRLACGKPLDSIYIGGGTPVALDCSRLRLVLEMACAYFDVNGAKEFSVEAGRPDALDKDKLSLLKSYGVTRISINPQTMHDQTLQAIGRNHTKEDFEEAFYSAREAGFDNINSDLILGLPCETPAHVSQTFCDISHFRPESLTVHTLAVKRASKLRETLESQEMTDQSQMEEMLRISSRACHEMGMTPYYMYRQKNMVGNFENVGYCLPGKESFYNVLIMEETQTIWAAGAGAVSKLMAGQNRFLRVANVKSLDAYIERIDEMIQRKEEKCDAIANPEGNKGHLWGGGRAVASS
jgi:oxygen-independent coproporphyrinogen-3 oxidase